MRTIKLCLALLCSVLLWACRGEEMVNAETYQTEEFKVAVIVPTELMPYWQRTAAWAQEILHRAQVGREKRVKVELEFHDERAADIDA